MSKADNFLSEVKRKKLFDEQYKYSSPEDLAKASLYLQQEQAASQTKMQKDIRAMLVIFIVIITINTIGYLWLLFFGGIYWNF